MTLIYFTSVWMDRYYSGSGSGWLWLVLGVLAGLMFLVTAVTVIFVREPPQITRHWGTSVRSALMSIFQKDIWRNRSFLWFLVSRLLIYMAFTTIPAVCPVLSAGCYRGVTNPARRQPSFPSPPSSAWSSWSGRRDFFLTALAGAG
jgi:hypothetical protein